MNPQDIANGVQHSGGVQLLAQVFGTWIYQIFHLSAPVAGGTPETAITIIGSTLVVGGGAMLLMFISYTALAGLIKTGQEGVFLGHQWDAPWIMLRSAGAAILLFPMSAGGVSGITLGQAMIIKVAMTTSALTDDIWRETGARVIESDLYKPGDQVPPDFRSLSISAMNTYKQDVEDGRCVETTMLLNSVPDIVKNAPPSVMIPGVLASYQQCNVDPNEFQAATETMAVPPESSQLSESGPNLLDFETPRINTSTYVDSMNTQVQQEVQALNNQAFMGGINLGKAQWADPKIYTSTWTENYETRVGLQEANILAAYVQAASRTAQGKISKLAAQKWQQSAEKSGGWITADQSYNSLADATSAVSDAVQNVETNLGNDDKNGKGSGSGSCGSSTLDKIKCWFSDHTPSMKNIWRSVSNKTGISGITYSPTANPMGQIKSIGTKIAGASAYVIGLGVFDSTIGRIGFWLAGIGIALAVVIPAIPAIYFMTGIFRWLISVCEAYLVQPFWNAAWAAPEGRQHMSSLAGNGFNILLYITLYPILLILGFVVAMGLMNVVLHVVDSWALTNIHNMFFSVIGQAEKSGVANLAGTPIAATNAVALTLPAILIEAGGWLLVWIGVLWVTMNMLFNLIHTLPDNLLNWISVHATGVDVFGKGEGQASHNFVFAQFGRTTGGASGLIKKLGDGKSGGGTNRLKEPGK